MKIAHVSMASVPGGVARVLQSLSTVQAAQHDVMVISGAGALLAGERVPVPWVSLKVRGNTDLLALVRLQSVLRSFRPDALLIHACAPGELVLLAALSRKRRTTILLEHLPEYQPLGSPLKNRLYAALARRSHAWLAVSAVGARALERRWRLPASAVGHVHLGVPQPPEGPERKEDCLLRRVAGLKIAGFGETSQRKGFPRFVEVAERVTSVLPDSYWFWVGGERDEQHGAVRVVPWTANIGGWLRQVDLMLVPSEAEGLPLIILEAFACGTPVVASRVGGIPEAIEDGQQGILLPPDDLEAWVTIVQALLQDENRRTRLSSAAQERWREDFTAEAMSQRIDALIQTCKASGRS